MKNVRWYVKATIADKNSENAYNIEIDFNVNAPIIHEALKIAAISLNAVFANKGIFEITECYQVDDSDEPPLEQEEETSA